MDEADVAVVGGSFAGAAAALHVARGRRRVAMFDHGVTRNRFARESHGFPGQDGASPAAIRAKARAEVLAYPEAALVEAEVTAARRDGEGFVLGWDGGSLRASRVVLAFGMRDLLPDVPGLADCWGLTANQCPYCHGYELAGRPTAVLMTGSGSLHQARILRAWTDDLLLVTDGLDLADADRADLAARGVRVVDGRLTGVEHEHGHVRAIAVDGQTVERGALYLAPRFEPASGLAAALGCAMADAELGRHVAADAMGAAGPGVFAAGDLVRPVYNATRSAAEGVTAGAAAHQSLL